MVTWLKQVNGGQGYKTDAHIKQMALLSQKILFPQLKPHPQPWLATSQIRQVERVAKGECVDGILKEIPNLFPVSCVPIAFFLHRTGFVEKNTWQLLSTHII